MQLRATANGNVVSQESATTRQAALTSSQPARCNVHRNCGSNAGCQAVNLGGGCARHVCAITKFDLEILHVRFLSHDLQKVPALLTDKVHDHHCQAKELGTKSKHFPLRETRETRDTRIVMWFADQNLFLS